MGLLLMWSQYGNFRPLSYKSHSWYLFPSKKEINTKKFPFEKEIDKINNEQWFHCSLLFL